MPTTSVEICLGERRRSCRAKFFGAEDRPKTANFQSSLPSIISTMQGKTVRRMRHSSQAVTNLPASITPRRKVMRLRRNQICPIHRSFSCCGRGVVPKVKHVRQLGVRRIEDPLHPRGYRELRSNGEMRKLLDRKIVSQNGKCGICGAEFTDYSDIVPDHISPRGMGGAWRDDHPENIQAVHWWCNGEKGSSRR
jgi:hypothetical protein